MILKERFALHHGASLMLLERSQGLNYSNVEIEKSMTELGENNLYRFCMDFPKNLSNKESTFVHIHFNC